MAHGVTFTTAGALPAPYGPVSSPTQQQVVRFFGVSVTQTGTTAGAVVLRDGGSSGSVVAAFNVPGAVGAVPGCADANYAIPRAVLNGLYVEIDTATGVNGTVWIS